MGLWPQTTAVTPLETPSFQGLGFPLAEHPVFLGVNLLTKGPGQCSDGNNNVWTTAHFPDFFVTKRILTAQRGALALAHRPRFLLIKEIQWE